VAKDNGSRLYELVAWVASALAVALATVVFVLVSSVYGATEDNRDDIKDLQIAQAVIAVRLLTIQEGIDEIKEGMGRLEKRFETKPSE
jgi:hypothetical protein